MVVSGNMDIPDDELQDFVPESVYSSKEKLEDAVLQAIKEVYVYDPELALKDSDNIEIEIKKK